MVGFPLLLIPLAVYNIIVFLMPSVSLSEVIVRLPMMSGAEWPINLGDILLALAALMLLLEIVKGARPGAKFLMDHLLSLLVFGGAAAEFLLLPKFGTSLYFLLTLFALVDFLSGVALRTRRGVVATVPVARTRGRDAPSLATNPGRPSARYRSKASDIVRTWPARMSASASRGRPTDRRLLVEIRSSSAARSTGAPARSSAPIISNNRRRRSTRCRSRKAARSSLSIRMK